MFDRFIALFIVIFCFLNSLFCADLPPPPKYYLNDSAHLISSSCWKQLNRELAIFDQKTSNQIVVVIYPDLKIHDTLEDWCQKLYSSWKIGSKKNSNGVLIVISIADKKIRIHTGYGLEGALPDALCSRIIHNEMIPLFLKKNFDEGLTVGLNSIIKATSNEYHGIKKKNDTKLKDFLFSPFGFILLLVVAILIILINRNPSFLGLLGTFMTGLLLGSVLGSSFSSNKNDDNDNFKGGGGDSGGGGDTGSW